MIPQFLSSTKIPDYLLEVFADQPQREVLDNGMVLLTKRVPGCGLASVQYWLRTGSIHEGPWLGSGISHYLEHMLFKGTENRPGNTVAQIIQEAGGYLNAYTSFDRTVYYAEGPSELAPLALDVLGDMAFAASLKPDDATAEKDVILREIDMGKDDPDNQLAQAVFKLAFKQSAMRFPIIGERELFCTLTAEDLRAYYQSRYMPGNAVLIIVGDFEEAAVRERLSALQASHPARPCAPVLIPSEAPQLATRQQRLHADVQVVRGAVAFRVPGLSHPQSPALDILASIMGHGRSSRLWQRLRDEQRIVTYIDATCWNPGSDGLFWISYTCKPGNQEAAEHAILQQCQAVAEAGVSEAELLRARQQATVSEINSRKTISGQAARLGLAEVVIGDGDYPRHYFEKLFSMSREDIQGAAKAFLIPSRLNCVTLEPKVELKPHSGETRPHTWPDFKDKLLPNGARILWQQVGGLPKIHLRMAMLGGPIYEAVSQRGACQLLATLLSRDTLKHSSAEVAERVEAAGGHFSSFCGNNSLGLGLEMLNADTELLLDVWADALLRRHFISSTLEAEREAQIASILEEEDDIVSYGRRLLRKGILAGHPFATCPDGLPEDLDQLNVEALEKLANCLIVPQNIVVAISGSFDEAVVLPRVEATLLELPHGEFNRLDTSFRDTLKQGSERVTLAREQAVVFQAYPDAGVCESDYTIGEVIEEICSEMSGKLFDEVRNKQGLAYFVGASRLSALKAGIFSFYAGTRPDATSKVQAAFSAEAKRLAAGQLTIEERDRAVTRLKAQKRMGLQTPNARAMHAALNTLYGYPPNYWRDSEARLDAVDIQAIQGFAQRYLAPDKAYHLVVGPE